MKTDRLRIRGIVLGPDRVTGRRSGLTTPTVTQDTSLWQATQLRANAATRRWVNSREPGGGFVGTVSKATRSVLTALGLL